MAKMGRKGPSIPEMKIYPVTAADYKLMETIGQGSSGTVYSAMCLPHTEVVAIKCCNLESEENLDDLRIETTIMSSTDHPNMVKAHCSFVVGQILWIVMPYMAGGSCYTIMKAAYPAGFYQPVIATVLKELLKALICLHGHGYIHRDVKAGNIFVGGDGAVKLGDFGTSCIFDARNPDHQIVGTPCWMAPEVLYNQGQGYDFKADIWSFGITALELARGSAPYSKYRDPRNVTFTILQNAPPRLDEERDKRFTKSFRKMIAMCLVKDPKNRPTAKELLKHSFFSKHPRSSRYIRQHVLRGLPPLGERFESLKMKGVFQIGDRNMPPDKLEKAQSQEHIFSWDYTTQDLIVQKEVVSHDLRKSLTHA